jgi:hypothetical protein
MNMMSYQNDVIHAKQRMSELMNEANNERLLPPQPSMSDQLLTTVGSWMISTGERLTRMSALETDDKKLSVIKTANG